MLCTQHNVHNDCSACCAHNSSIWALMNLHKFWLRGTEKRSVSLSWLGIEVMAAALTESSVQHATHRATWPWLVKWWWLLFDQMRGFWENIWQIIPHQRFFFFFKVEISLRTLMPLIIIIINLIIVSSSLSLCLLRYFFQNSCMSNGGVHSKVCWSQC